MQNNYLRTNDIDTEPAEWTDEDIDDILREILEADESSDWD